MFLIKDPWLSDSSAYKRVISLMQRDSTQWATALWLLYLQGLQADLRGYSVCENGSGPCVSLRLAFINDYRHCSGTYFATTARLSQPREDLSHSPGRIWG